MKVNMDTGVLNATWAIFGSITDQDLEYIKKIGDLLQRVQSAIDNGAATIEDVQAMIKEINIDVIVGIDWDAAAQTEAARAQLHHGLALAGEEGPEPA